MAGEPTAALTGWHLTLSDLSPGMLRDAKKSLKVSSRSYSPCWMRSRCRLKMGSLTPYRQLGCSTTCRMFPARREKSGACCATAKLIYRRQAFARAAQAAQPFLPKQKSETLGGGKRWPGNGEAILKRIFQQVTRYDILTGWFEEPAGDRLTALERSIQTALDPDGWAVCRFIGANWRARANSGIGRKGCLAARKSGRSRSTALHLTLHARFSRRHARIIASASGQPE